MHNSSLINLNFPSTLTHLIISGNYKCEKIYIPPELTHLQLWNFSGNIIFNDKLKFYDVIYSKQINFDISIIPPSVKNFGFELFLTNNKIYNIPLGIEQLRVYIYSLEALKYLDNLPITLKKLYIIFTIETIINDPKQITNKLKIPFDCEIIFKNVIINDEK